MLYRHYDEETGILTFYDVDIEGAQIDFNDSWCISLYEYVSWPSAGRKLLYTMIDCPKELLWTLPKPEYLTGGSDIRVEYLEDGYMRQEVLATKEEAVDIARRAVYDECGLACIAVTRTLSIGTSTVWLEAERERCYRDRAIYNARLVVEFGNSEECTRFLHEDMRMLEGKYIYELDTGVGVIGDFSRALLLITGNINAAEINAAERCVPYSQFFDDLPQPETQLIRHRTSNRGDDRPCYLTLDISLDDLCHILRLDWSATTIPLTFPSHSSTFWSLNNLHLKFPSPASQDRNSNSSSQSQQDDLTITISAREISFTTGTDSVSLGSGFTLSSDHRTVTVNYINATPSWVMHSWAPSMVGTTAGGTTSTPFAYRALLVLVRLV
ncbi:hypothetical protein BDN71DRAFT_1451481 [Pleurotus eryngii]|uniref:Uncharacterized protein n=1 Tax=Pleurotus eryngii TaxID=5323 RepID=A0A9P5ZQR3_PLEER|nr:hypothetical protein BDN71DRAFT_1451481 [Pleurotus eryngii]